MAIALAALILHEPLTWHTVLGAVVIVLGVTLMMTQLRPKSALE